jgi:hypothetical protein
MLQLRRFAMLSFCLLGSCVYADVHAPLAYRSPTPLDVQAPLGPEVTGEACSQVVLGLVAWGDGGYGAAVEDAKAKSGAALLVDVQSDRTLFNVLSVYQKVCTRVRGRSVR